MNKETLYDAITQVKEEYIQEVLADKDKKRTPAFRRLVPWCVVAACLVLTLVTPVRGWLAEQLKLQSSDTVAIGDSTGGAEENAGQPETAQAEVAQPAEGADSQQDVMEEDIGGVPSSENDEVFVPEGTIVTEGPEMDAVYCYGEAKDGTYFLFESVQRAIEEHKGEDVLYFLGIDLFQNNQCLEPDSEAAAQELSRLRGEGYLVGYAEGREDEGETSTYAAGYFTAEELESFTPSENYGYAFYFREEEYYQTAEGIRLADTN